MSAGMSEDDGILWRCRRGMLELDVLLERFYHDAYDQLPSASKKAFIDLLSCEDQQLYRWLLGYDKDIRPDLVDIVANIQAHKH
jgi:antitoxin CptB